MDIVNVVLAYTNEHYAKEPTQNLVGAFKLKVEFLVLNQLVDISRQSQLAYRKGRGGRCAAKVKSQSDHIIVSDGKAKSLKPQGSGQKNMSAFYEDSSMPSTVTDSSINAQPLEPAATYPAVYPVQLASSRTNHSLEGKSNLDSHHEVGRTFQSNPSTESLTLRYDPTNGNVIIPLSRPLSFWRRIWAALPTGEDEENLRSEK